MKKIILGLIAGVMALSVSAMEFEVKTYTQDGGKYVNAWGPIEVSDAEDFKAFLAKNKLPAGTEIWLYSGGGSVWAAQEMAKMIRSNGFDTAVNGPCESACTDMFLGGKNRYLVSDDGKLGYHAASVSEEYMDEIDDIHILELGQFFGVSEVYFGLQYITPGKHINFAKLIFDAHNRVESSIMMYPSTQMLLNAGVVTKIIR